MSSKLSITSALALKSGYKIPVLGYGAYQTPAGTAGNVVLQAIKTGYRHVDSAVYYENEESCAIGMINSGVPREQLFFTTKVPPNKMGYQEAKRCIEESLTITKLGYIDLYLLHGPFGGKEGRTGAWKALVEGVEEGKIRSIGVSNFGVYHLEELEKFIKDDLRGKKEAICSVNQLELHPWLARKDIVAWCKERGILLEAYCPIVRGQKNGHPTVTRLAKKHGKTPAQILLRWSLQMGFVPLPKSVTPSRIEENTKVFDFRLDKEDMEALDFNVYEPIAWDPTVNQD